jgi:hypothetical protein
MDQLFVRQYQTFILRGKGISKIVENDIYEVEDKADIIVKIIFG